MADIDTNLPTPINNTTPATADNGLPVIPVSGGHIEQNNYIQNGDGTQIGEVKGNLYSVTYTSNIFRTCLPLGFVGRRDCYSVLVCDYDDDNVFILRYSNPKTAFEDKRTLQKYIDEFTPLTRQTIDALKRVPALVMKPNKSEFPKGTAMLGYLTDIEPGNPIQIKFFLITQIPGSCLAQHFDELNIKYTDLWNEFHEERWNIKQGDLFEVLKQAGLRPPVL